MNEETPVDREAAKMNAEHFRMKEEWKTQPGNHFLPGAPTPLDDARLVLKSEPAGLVLDWI